MAKPDFSRKILTALSGKKAAKVAEVKAEVAGKGPKTASSAEGYAITRSLKNLADTGLVETHAAGQGEFVRLTQKGRQKLASLKLDSKNSLVSSSWDGKWRIILLDLPESRKQEREALRYLLKKAGFILLKNSAWISPFPFEFMFENLKKDFGLSTEIMIIVTSTIDAATEESLHEMFALSPRD